MKTAAIPVFYLVIMNAYALSALANLITSVVLGLLVFFEDKKGSVNRMFALFTLAVAFWSYWYFTWQIEVDMQPALLWIHLLMAGAIFITPVYFHFVACFLGLERKLWFWIGAGYAFATFFSVINWVGGL